MIVAPPAIIFLIAQVQFPIEKRADVERFRDSSIATNRAVVASIVASGKEQNIYER